MWFENKVTVIRGYYFLLRTASSAPRYLPFFMDVDKGGQTKQVFPNENRNRPKVQHPKTGILLEDKHGFLISSSPLEIIHFASL